MIIQVKVPKWGLTMEKAEVVKWVKQEGDTVQKDEHLVEMMTEKITNYIDAPESGVLSKIMVKEGESAEVGQVVAEIETGVG